MYLHEIIAMVSARCQLCRRGAAQLRLHLRLIRERMEQPMHRTGVVNAVLRTKVGACLGRVGREEQLMRVEAGLRELIVLREQRWIRQRAHAHLKAAVVRRALREHDPYRVALQARHHKSGR